MCERKNYWIIISIICVITAAAYASMISTHVLSVSRNLVSKSAASYTNATISKASTMIPCCMK